MFYQFEALQFIKSFHPQDFTQSHSPRKPAGWEPCSVQAEDWCAQGATVTRTRSDASSQSSDGRSPLLQHSTLFASPCDTEPVGERQWPLLPESPSQLSSSVTVFVESSWALQSKSLNKGRMLTKQSQDKHLCTKIHTVAFFALQKKWALPEHL